MVVKIDQPISSAQRIQPTLNELWNFRTKELSFPGTFVLWNFHPQEWNLHGTSVPEV